MPRARDAGPESSFASHWRSAGGGVPAADSVVLRGEAAVVGGFSALSGIRGRIENCSERPVRSQQVVRLPRRRGTEVVVTGAPRKRLVRKGTWVRIPPSPPSNLSYQAKFPVEAAPVPTFLHGFAAFPG